MTSMAGNKCVSACRWIQRPGGRAQNSHLLDAGVDDDGDDGDDCDDCDGDDDTKTMAKTMRTIY